MRVAIIAHSYQAKTKSNEWFLELVRAHARTVDLIWDEEWIGGTSISIENIVAADYDRVFVYQLPHVVSRLVDKIADRLVFIPMYDAVYELDKGFWTSLQATPILNLSWTLHTHVQRMGVNSLHTQYFPDPTAFKPSDNFETLRGLFWLRRKDLGWPRIKHLASGAEWSEFHIHNSPDPDLHEPMTASASTPSAEDVKKFNIKFSKWMDRGEFDEIAHHANVFFAPRRREGIGMAFLEAMTRGQCVIAPNFPTHSEYITNGVSGILYDPDTIRSLDLSAARQLGANARHTIEAGFARWSRDRKERLPEFLFGSPSDRRKVTYSNFFKTAGRQHLARRDARFPSVTVAVVVRDAENCLAETLRSVASQNYPNLELVVVDGASQDRTLEIIRDHGPIIDRWISEKDQGPYDGMNKAASLASGKWILFMNAGDTFFTPSALSEAVRDAPDEADFIIGHHVYHDAQGVEELHKASEFSETWKRLNATSVDYSLLAGMPCHQATLTRVEILRKYGGYNYRNYPIAADHEFLYRMCEAGARFHHSDAIIANYFYGGISSQNESLCHRDWYRLARQFGKPKAANRFFASAFPKGIEWRDLPMIFWETPSAALLVFASKLRLRLP